MRAMMISAAAAGLALAASAEAAPVNLPAWQSTVKYSTTSTGASGFRNYARATSKVVYDAGAGTYVIRDTGSLSTTETFGPSNQAATNANTVSGIIAPRVARFGVNVRW